jgi:hypothetical protein
MSNIEWSVEPLYTVAIRCPVCLNWILYKEEDCARNNNICDKCSRDREKAGEIGTSQ